MGDSKDTRKKWPTILGILSILYTMLYGLLYLRPSGNAMQFIRLWNMTVVVAMFLGAVGLVTRRSWATGVVRFASWLAIAQAAYALVTVYAFMGGPPPVFAALGMLTAMLPVVAWPLFLVIWLSGHDLGDVAEPGLEITEAQQ